MDHRSEPQRQDIHQAMHRALGHRDLALKAGWRYSQLRTGLGGQTHSTSRQSAYKSTNGGTRVRKSIPEGINPEFAALLPGRCRRPGATAAGRRCGKEPEACDERNAAQPARRGLADVAANL